MDIIGIRESQGYAELIQSSVIEFGNVQSIIMGSCEGLGHMYRRRNYYGCRHEFRLIPIAAIHCGEKSSAVVSVIDCSDCPIKLAINKLFHIQSLMMG